jgi:predicted MPP superfamily phosphohydrolase
LGRDPFRKTSQGWHWSTPTWAKFGALAVAGALAMVGYARQIEPRWLQWKRLALPIAGLAPAFDGFRLMQLSDLHLAAGRALTPTRLEAIIRRVNRLRPDLVVVTGDFISAMDPVSHEGLVALRQIKAAHGVFGVVGNHDYWHGLDPLLETLEAIGVKVLFNERHVIWRGSDALAIAGVDDAWEGQPDLDCALEGIPSETPVVLLAHEPNYAARAIEDARVRLQLSGHTHGGQIRIPFVGPIVLPDMGYLYPQGLYRVQRAGGPPLLIYTNRGVGVAEIPLRLFCRPEITLFMLKTAEPAR